VPAGGMHQLEGVSGVVAGELPVALDDVAADDGGTCTKSSGRAAAPRPSSRPVPSACSHHPLAGANTRHS
jgi:hypothetical protein